MGRVQEQAREERERGRRTGLLARGKGRERRKAGLLRFDGLKGERDGVGPKRVSWAGLVSGFLSSFPILFPISNTTQPI